MSLGAALLVAVASIELSPPVSLRAAVDEDAVHENYSVTAWTSESGLPADMGSVSSITQDLEGFLWIGTRRGLVRFDGSRFATWGSRGEPALAGVGVSALITSRDGNLWVAYSDVDGISRIHGGRVEHFTERDGLPKMPFQILLEDRGSTVWAAGRSGLVRFKDGQWRQLGKDQGIPAAQVFSLYEDRLGRLWVGTSAGVLRRPADADRFALVDGASTFVQAFAEDHAGVILVTDPQRVVRALSANEQPGVARSVRLPVAGWRLLQDPRADVWVAALGAGLLRVRENLTTGGAFVESFNDAKITGSVLALFADRESNIWVGMRGGLLKVAASFVTASTRLEGLTHEGVRGLSAARDGSVWVATTHNLNRFFDQGRKVYDVAQIEALHTDQTGAVWVVTLSGIRRYRNGRFESVPIPAGLRLEGISSVTIDARDGLWLCGRRAGLLRLQQGVLNRFEGVPQVAQKTCSSVYADQRGRVWVGFATGGIAVYEAGHFRSFGERDGLVAGNPTGILEDSSGAVWICTSSGVSRFSGDRLTTLTRKNGLPDMLGPSIVEDAEGFLWTAAGSGIVRFSPTEVDKIAANPRHQIQYTVYDPSEGPSDVSPSLSSPAAVRGGDGRLWFATVKGVSVIDPRRLRTNRRPIPVRIEGAVADGRNVAASQSPVLSSQGSTLLIEYAALSLSATSRLRFRYKLDGFDDDWSYAGERRQATYVNLPRGNYRFRVTATVDGLWKEPEAVWTFSVLPAFYQTTWFYAICAGSAAAALWAYWRLRLHAVANKYGLVLAERTRVSRDIHDTLLQSLGAVGLELEVVARHLSSREQAASDVLRRLQHQVAQCIQETRQSVWDLRSPGLEQRPLVDAVREVASRATSGRDVHVEVRAMGRQRQCQPSTEEELLRIASEATINAVKHGQADTIHVELEYRRRSLRLRVSDNGCGFVVAAVPTTGEHCGLINMRERAAKLKGRFSVTSNPGAGTVVEATVPLT